MDKFSLTKSDTTKETKGINFQQVPKEDLDAAFIEDLKSQITTELTKPESIPMPYEHSTNSYLSLVLSPNLRELELMIRGLEYVKRTNPISKREEIFLRKIEGHPLNEYGINKLMEFLKTYSSPEIKLGRKRPRDYYLSVRQVGRDVIRLIYKNLKNFGMDTQVKQRSAKTFALAIIEFADAAFSRSIEGKENDLSRATEFKIEGSIDNLNDPARMFNKQAKENLKN